MNRLLTLIVLVSLAVAPGAFALGTAASLGDTVWYDTNNNGVQDDGEPGIAGVVVTAQRYDANGVLRYNATRTTNSTGYYLFQSLLAGTYRVTTNVTNLDQTYDLDGTSTPNYAVATLATSQARRDVDFGYVGGSLGDYVWLDADRDGEQDAAEQGISGVTLSLLDGTGATLATTVTNASGLYTFSGLKAGSYTVQVDFSTIPADLEPSYDLDGISTANIATASLTRAQNRTDVDFGYKPPVLGSIGDYVWLDVNGDGIQDATESGIPNVTMQLYSNDVLLATTATNGSGLYLFSNLRVGTYTVQVVASTLPANVAPTYDLDGIATAHVATASLGYGEDRRDVDFGYWVPDTRHYMTNSNGGWGSNPTGDNPGTLLHTNFPIVYPNGMVVGSLHYIRFDSAQEITDALPLGGAAGTLIRDYDPPTATGTSAGQFAGQVVGNRLSLDFSNAGVTRYGLGRLKIQSGTFQGMTVTDFVQLCEEILGGKSDNLQYTLPDLSNTAAQINLNYDKGAVDNGFLAP
ncbi:MAG: SdrD B-like domain-containing protein [Armatimonadia bacterium]